MLRTNHRLQTRFNILILFSVLLFPVFSGCGPASAEAPDFSQIYQKTGKDRYVTGLFKPESHPDFVSLDRSGIAVNRAGHYLRKEAVAALQDMIQAFHREHPGIKIQVLSSTRNYDSQASIWGAKWNGTRKVEGKSLLQTHPDPVQRAKKILEYSSMPGTSRHHWGTDLDLNSLNNQYFSQGEGLILYNWLSRNGSRYGFCQPYNAGRSEGYMEEKWHWSYRPIASLLQQEWNRQFDEHPEKILLFAKFPGARESIHLAPVYVNAINPECLGTGKE